MFKNLPIKTALAVLDMVLNLVARAIKLVDVIRDLLDDGSLNESVKYITEDVRAFQNDMNDWLKCFTDQVETLRHDMD